jgi:hypothetical protein
MIKNIFEVNNEEKSRILNLHERATKRQYMSEQSITTDTTEPIDNKSKQYPSNADYASFFIDLTGQDRYGVDKAIEKSNNRGILNIFKKDLKNLKKDVDETIFDRRASVDSRTREQLQIELSKNMDVVNELKALADNNPEYKIHPEYYNIK